ncbi:MAG: flagellar biosynthesis protein FlhB, partial [Gammaproteobacteria bacterium]|nr:flagellar biosynthesis protein FlhB [Gammaproteobacteria bacterium]
MADTRQEDRTEQATPKRLDDARKKGDIPRSRELSMASVLMTGALVLYANGAQLGTSMREMMTRALTFDRAALDDPDYVTEALGQSLMAALDACTPLFAALVAAAFLGTIAIGGWIFTPAPLAFRFERLDPVAGIGRMFSLNSLVEVLKALAKAGFIVLATVALLLGTMDQLLGLSDQPLVQAMGSALSLSLLTLAICSGALLLIAAVDAPYQLWAHARKLKMTRKEIEDELKESEGSPEVRQRVRQMQQEVARRRMLESVPQADVVITNPTHFAVALRYDDARMRAPVVLAKGADETAARIREIATEHKVTLFESPLLARALYWTTDLGQEIPSQLYLAVAQVLTYVYRLKVVRERGGPWPERPAVEVDEKLASGPQRRR